MKAIHVRCPGLSRVAGGRVDAAGEGDRLPADRNIALALDALRPDPPLFPGDPARRAAVERAESWGDEAYQPVPLTVRLAPRSSGPRPTSTARPRRTCGATWPRCPLLEGRPALERARRVAPGYPGHARSVFPPAWLQR